MQEAGFSPEPDFERSIRPKRINEFCGQPQLVENLAIYIESARQRGDALDHTLFHGPPGLGKTTLSRIVAAELGVQITETSGPVLEKPADLAGILTSFNANDVLFIDEIHRLSPVVEEYLYGAMEDYKIDILVDAGPQARPVTLPLKPFTLIGATTRVGLLTAPLQSRFGIKCHLEYYSEEIMLQILNRSADKIGLELQQEAAVLIAKRSRGTPRIANNLLRRVRDFALVLNDGIADAKVSTQALEAMKVDECGLDEMDNKILNVILEQFKGGPVGLGTIAIAVGEEAETIEEVHEPFLVQQGFLERTRRGRIVTEKAYTHLRKVQAKSGIQPNLFS